MPFKSSVKFFYKKLCIQLGGCWFQIVVNRLQPSQPLRAIMIGRSTITTNKRQGTTWSTYVYYIKQQTYRHPSNSELRLPNCVSFRETNTLLCSNKRPHHQKKRARQKSVNKQANQKDKIKKQIRTTSSTQYAPDISLLVKIGLLTIFTAACVHCLSAHLLCRIQVCCMSVVYRHFGGQCIKPLTATNSWLRTTNRWPNIYCLQHEQLAKWSVLDKDPTQKWDY